MTTKQVDAGTESFSKIIDSNCYNVDKTRFLRPVFATPRQCKTLYPSPPLWKDPDHGHVSGVPRSKL